MDFFTYWVRRIAKGGDVLVFPRQNIQVIDVRDLCQWITRMIETHSTGVYNTTGPSISSELFFQSCTTKNKANFIEVDEGFLLQQGVNGWSELPFWMPSKDKENGFFGVSSKKAEKKGLCCRPFSETAHWIYQWDAVRKDMHLKVGLQPDKEKELLNKYKSQQQLFMNALK